MRSLEKNTDYDRFVSDASYAAGSKDGDAVQQSPAEGDAAMWRKRPRWQMSLLWFLLAMMMMMMIAALISVVYSNIGGCLLS